jgi:DNA anti-recombination protein RmuC
MEAKFNDRLDKMEAKWEDRFEKMEAKFNDRLDKMEAKWDAKFNEHLNVVQLLRDQNKSLAESLAAFHTDLRTGTLRYNAPAAKE